MQTGSESFTIEEDGWVMKIHPPKEQYKAQVLLAIHGHTGNENVMDIFAQRIPPNFWRISPRAPFQADPEGFSWLDMHPGNPTDYPAYQTIAHQLRERLHNLQARLDLPRSPVHLMGFSQGAGLAFTYLIEFPSETGFVAGLAGFLPDGSQSALSPGKLTGKRVFVAHGTRDTIVPISRAQEAVDMLQSSGAEVTFCEDEVAHKLSANCFQGLGRFFSQVTK